MENQGGVTKLGQWIQQIRTLSLKFGQYQKVP